MFGRTAVMRVDCMAKDQRCVPAIPDLRVENKLRGETDVFGVNPAL